MNSCQFRDFLDLAPLLHQGATTLRIALAGLVKRLEERKIHVELTEAAKEQVVREGYDPTYGARPLKRTIQKRVLDPLALRVLEGQFSEGDVVLVDAGADGLTFEKGVSIKA